MSKGPFISHAFNRHILTNSFLFILQTIWIHIVFKGNYYGYIPWKLGDVLDQCQDFMNM